ncbi:single-stranded-DNA-specific exonuclease RecJ [candidate division KSB1 bacterium]|nr:single-stranded-DNA-specific exonuclease RecJ [bacterium]OQX60604.1 MAG: single-stranded-DNA-specific exonuclease RecJ [candidate division KSB1 bacterium 4484_219]RKY79984.1 MAG: single-stranded-DNA-specific exonuclease RecJ [candidate division KSB1 bacterium]RKY83902.1 MAG: single-stranded-DNA-specific exonuclease RecJ [candidate division KSB1 bacterium]RKY89221.1 MAG: single-stranded-DNA-specific exonuclease RecJ [candidate division KSB1 bacterium]
MANTKLETHWLPPKVDPQQVKNLAEQLRVPPIIGQILLNRGINSFDKAKEFFRPNLQYLHDPFLMMDMEKAVERLAVAIKQKQRIVIYGDYDVDGTTAISMLYLFLKQMGAPPRFYIPDRLRDGYGLSENGIREIFSWGTDLILTTDCGITGVKEVALANKLGMEVIISDHHEPGEKLPPALAVLNPKREDCSYPFKELAGVGVAFKLIQGLVDKFNLSKDYLEQCLDLVALGSAADIVPLTGENRILVKLGLETLRCTEKLGLRALIKSSGLLGRSIGTGQVVFILAPRINAVGRMGSAARAVHLLVADSERRADNIAKILETENRNRRNLDEEIYKEAVEIMERQFDPERDWSIVLHKEGWHPGVVGIVASRLVERYYRPTVMIALGDELDMLNTQAESQGGKIGKGSARSIPGFDIYSALKACQNYLISFGGHKFAAGLSIQKEMIPAFRNAFNQVARQMMTSEHLIPKICFDGVLKLNEIDAKFIRLLKLFAPHGPQNMRPVFLSTNLEVVGTPQIVGNNHLKFKVRQRGAQNRIVIDAIGFNLGDLIYRISPGEANLDMIYVIEENEFQGERSLQLRVKDLR